MEDVCTPKTKTPTDKMSVSGRDIGGYLRSPSRSITVRYLSASVVFR